MRIHSKLTVAFLTLAVSSALAFGQAAAPPPPGPPPAGPNGPQSLNGPHSPNGPHSMDGHSHWHHHGAWQRRGGSGMQWGHMHREFMLARMVRNPDFRARVGISADQANKIRTETFQFRESQIRNRADVQVRELELHQLLSAQNPDRSAIDQKLAQVETARMDQAKAAIDFRLDMRAALTPEQKQKLQQMREDFFRHRNFNHGGNAPQGTANSPNSGN